MKKFSRPKPIQPFKTIGAEADFWDTHDTSPLIKMIGSITIKGKKTVNISENIDKIYYK